MQARAMVDKNIYVCVATVCLDVQYYLPDILSQYDISSCPPSQPYKVVLHIHATRATSDS